MLEALSGRVDRRGIARWNKGNLKGEPGGGGRGGEEDTKEEADALRGRRKYFGRTRGCSQSVMSIPFF